MSTRRSTCSSLLLGASSWRCSARCACAVRAAGSGGAFKSQRPPRRALLLALRPRAPRRSSLPASARTPPTATLMPTRLGESTSLRPRASFLLDIFSAFNPASNTNATNADTTGAGGAHAAAGAAAASTAKSGAALARNRAVGACARAGGHYKAHWQWLGWARRPLRPACARTSCSPNCRSSPRMARMRPRAAACLCAAQGGRARRQGGRAHHGRHRAGRCEPAPARGDPARQRG